jgi:hypothetical protein
MMMALDILLGVVSRVCYAFPRELDTNFVCVDASSLVPEKLLKCGHNDSGVLCFLVRWKGFDEELDDWVPSSELPVSLVDEFYCSQLNMPTPVFDPDYDDSDLDDDEDDFVPFVPLSQRQIKRQLREAGCFGKFKKPVVTLPKTVIQNLMVGPSAQDPLTVSSIRAQVEKSRQRILRLGLLNARLQTYLNARSRKPPPRPPDPSLPIPSSPRCLLTLQKFLAYFHPTI